MDKGIHIGRLFGINIRIDWSWFLIFALVSWNLGTSFVYLHPEWSNWLNWGVAILAALLFFASVLGHEMAHALVAKAHGMSVNHIKLFLFGGVSNIEREPPSPGVEFVMALVGPLTSIFLGSLLLISAGLTVPAGGAISNLMAFIGQLNPLITLLIWLGSINIFLGLFNLLPGFPLDGGRILRSIFWAVTKNLRKATSWASKIGQGIAWLMILIGFAMIFGVKIPILGTGLGSGIWMLFIGWFLHNGAVTSYRQVVVQDILEGVPVSLMMRTNPPTVTSNTTIEALVHEKIMNSDEHAFPVLDDGKLVGMVTLDDVRQISRTDWNTTTTRNIMTPFERIVSVAPDEDAAEALYKLQRLDVRQLPVMSNGTMAGLLRRRDIVKWLQLQSDEWNENT